jgi:ADP-ribosyl-[dinitrogen reductase] hydrolase
METYNNQIDGCIFGLVVGDALGGPLEFTDRDVLGHVSEMEFNYLYDFPAGHWTEKTSQMLCMLVSITENHGFNLDDFVLKLYRFITEGYMSPNERPFEVSYFLKSTGYKIGQCLKYHKKIPIMLNPYEYFQTDCGPLYRIAPLVVKYHQQPPTCLQEIENAVRVTHSSKVCIDVCLFYGTLMLGALQHYNKDQLLSETFTIHRDLVVNPYFPSVMKLQRGSYKHKSRDQINSDDEILNCVEASLWSFYQTTSFEDGCQLAINLGNNSSAIGLIYGQLAGLYYGLDQIPQRWLTPIHQRQYIQQLLQQN